MSALCAVLALVSASPSVVKMGVHPKWGRFQEFMTKYNRVYSDATETAMRFDTFVAHAEDVAELTRKAKELKSDVAFDELAKFADRTTEEKKPYFGIPRATGLSSPEDDDSGMPDYPGARTRKPPTAFTPPAEWDWREHGAVGKVRDQDQCGDCWAFSATEEVESMMAVAGQGSNVLSVQELTSCDKKTKWNCPAGNCNSMDAGCNGGDPAFGILYICNVSMGLAAEASYPFTSGKKGNTGKCSRKQSKPVVATNCHGYSWATKGCDEGGCKGQDEELLKANVAAYGPVAVSVDAEKGWQSYKKGVMPAKLCSPSGANSLDHAVQLVGYGTDNGQDYWWVRNSWNTDWGEEGYIRLARGDGVNACGVADQPLFADFLTNYSAF